jgi:hypothetical protein
MLFRKLRLDWRYAFSELVIVVAGVLIALTADGWLQRRADRGLERRYLDDLVVDLRSDTAQLRTAIALAADRAVLGHAVLRAMDGDTILTPPELVVALERQFYFAFPAYSQTTMSDLLSTGNLRLIRDRGFKRQLSEYYQTIERLEQWTENWRAIQRDVERIMPELLPLPLREAVITPAAPSAGWNGTWPPSPWAPDFSVSEADAREIHSRLRAHPEARARIEGMVRVQGNQYGVLTVIRDRALSTLAAAESAAYDP